MRKQSERGTASTALPCQVQSLSLTSTSTPFFRALLADTKILALDEATANVDRLTDSLIQESLRSLITQKNKTLLVIAHRIDTVLNCDLLLVLDKGVLVEFGPPAELLSSKDGHFVRMVSTAKQALKFDLSS